MAIDVRFSKKAGAVAAIAVAGVSLTSIPTAVHAEGPANRPPALDRRGVQVAAAPGIPKLPAGLSALSWTVADADSGDVLAAKDPHRELAPASTLKTLFAVTVLPKFPAGAVRQVSAEDLDGIGAGSSLVGVEEGESYQVADLWRGVFLRSGNDAVHVLASMNGGWETTAQEMQETARELGARDTTVKSPDGYDVPGQVSSAYDLTVFARAGLANEDFVRYCSTARAEFPTADGEYTEIENTNRLLAGSHGMERYPGIIGVKNGYTTNAGNTLIAAAQRDGHTLLVTVMNPQSGENNGVYKEARALLDWGFNSVEKVQPIGSLRTARDAADEDDDAGGGDFRPVARSAPDAEAGDGSPWRSSVALWSGGIGAAVLAAGAALTWRLRLRGRGTPGEGDRKG
ncbi:D-alanyl-D-alanine carboxypeptidase family protein [Streptomyces sp. x-80]|jgi:D-alanyl-D-alanine carboxypeptidase (penicillin-binding protein 5/6)|uniref:D-alanyl-D-alanine carboxypeptidase family protein n=1 Tax=Streptomyces sp. x-80 TaxID=2789282 RepID=UPI00398139A0